MEESRITGVHVDYYMVCRRKLWLFSKNIKMEEKSDLVAMGKIIDESSFAREKKHIMIDGTICIDFMEGRGVIAEVKKSRSIDAADAMQVRYYLYYLRRRGVAGLKGVIHYPKLRQKVEVDLDESGMADMERITAEIKDVLLLENPPPAKKTKICGKCAYYELCYA